MHHLGNIRALGMLLVEIVVISTAVSISMRRMLELTDYILLVSCSMAWSHLVMLLIQDVLAILIVHIVSRELVLVCVPLHHIVLMHVYWSHGMAALVQNDTLILLINGLRVI